MCDIAGFANGATFVGTTGEGWNELPLKLLPNGRPARQTTNDKRQKHFTKELVMSLEFPAWDIQTFRYLQHYFGTFQAIFP